MPELTDGRGIGHTDSSAEPSGDSKAKPLFGGARFARNLYLARTSVRALAPVAPWSGGTRAAGSARWRQPPISGRGQRSTSFQPPQTQQRSVRHPDRRGKQGRHPAGATRACALHRCYGGCRCVFVGGEGYPSHCPTPPLSKGVRAGLRTPPTRFVGHGPRLAKVAGPILLLIKDWGHPTPSALPEWRRVQTCRMSPNLTPRQHMAPAERQTTRRLATRPPPPTDRLCPYGVVVVGQRQLRRWIPAPS